MWDMTGFMTTCHSSIRDFATVKGSPEAEHKSQFDFPCEYAVVLTERRVVKGMLFFDKMSLLLK